MAGASRFRFPDKVMKDAAFNFNVSTHRLYTTTVWIKMSLAVRVFLITTIVY